MLWFVQEIAPDRVRLVSETSLPMCNEMVLYEVSDGGILIVQDSQDSDGPNTVAVRIIFVYLTRISKKNSLLFAFQNHANELYNMIQVEISQNTDSNQFLFNQNEIVPPIHGDINLVFLPTLIFFIDMFGTRFSNILRWSIHNVFS